jgi:hypothetical protein
VILLGFETIDRGTRRAMYLSKVAPGGHLRMYNISKDMEICRCN